MQMTTTGASGMVYVRLLTANRVDRTTWTPVARWRGDCCLVTVRLPGATRNPRLRYDSYRRTDGRAGLRDRRRWARLVRFEVIAVDAPGAVNAGELVPAGGTLPEADQRRGELFQQRAG